jgi:hypothetical protein
MKMSPAALTGRKVQTVNKYGVIRACLYFMGAVSDSSIDNNNFSNQLLAACN